MQPTIYNCFMLTTLILVASVVNDAYCWTVESLPNFDGVLTEDLHWKSPNLYLTDFGTGQIKRFDTTTNKSYTCQLENAKEVSFIVPQRNSDKLFVVGTRHSAVEVEWDGFTAICPIRRTFFTVESTDPMDVPNCLLEGKCDARGRLFSGTANCDEDLRLARRHLFKYADGRVDIVRNDVNVSNGIAFNDKRKEFYHIDIGANTITRLNYDVETGVASNVQTVFTLDPSQYPTGNAANFDSLDSMAIDTDGYIYAAIFGGKHILKISPDTWQVLESYEMPCEYLSSITFGGPNMDILYVGSTAHFFHDANFAKPCGDTFQVLGLGARGQPEYPCALK